MMARNLDHHVPSDVLCRCFKQREHADDHARLVTCVADAHG